MPEALQLPDDLQRGLILLSMHGQEHLWIENFRGLSSYSSEEVADPDPRWLVKICGSHMGNFDLYKGRNRNYRMHLQCLFYLSREDYFM